jgi:hypothetical protein
MRGAGYAGTPGALVAVVILLVLVAVTQPAGAAFPGQNGEIAYTKYSPRDDDFRIYTVGPDGTGQSTLGEWPGYHDGQVEGGPPLLDVTGVDPL